MNAAPIRVHLAAVDPMRERALAASLGGSDLELVGTSGITREVPRFCLRVRAQVAIIGAGPVPLEVLPLVTALRDGRPRIESVVLIEHPPNRERILALLNCGARGILRENVSTEELTRAARAVAAGGSVLNADATEVAIERASRAQHEFIGAPLESLDIEILGLLASGHTSGVVARRLGIDAVTVRSTLRYAKRVFGTRTQEGVVAAAIKRGII